MKVNQYLEKLIVVIVFFVTVNSHLQLTDSTHFTQYVNDRNYFFKLQETVSSKNQYIGLQWCIDLLNKYIELEERKFKEMNKLDE